MANTSNINCTETSKGHRNRKLYTSQTFANIYLNELDQYATRKLKVPFYYRYMDDIVILFKTKKDAKEALDKIKKF